MCFSRSVEQRCCIAGTRSCCSVLAPLWLPTPHCKGHQWLTATASQSLLARYTYKVCPVRCNATGGSFINSTSGGIIRSFRLLGKVAEGLTVEAILNDWEALKPIIMEEWNEPDKEPLVELFGNVRDKWIAEDLHGWIGANRFYPGTVDALKFAASDLYIVTTKQVRFPTGVHTWAGKRVQ